MSAPAAAADATAATAADDHASISKWPESLPYPKSNFFLSVICGNSRFHWALHDTAAREKFHACLYWKTTAPKPASAASRRHEEEEAEAAPCAQDFFPKYFPEKASRMLLANEKDPPPPVNNNNNNNNNPTPPPPTAVTRAVVQKLLPLFALQDIPILTIYVISTNATAFANLQHLMSRLPTRLILLQGQDFFNPSTCMPAGYTGMGVDRLAALCAAEQMYGGPSLVIDGGTATTFTATAIREDAVASVAAAAAGAAAAAVAATGPAAGTNTSSMSVWNTVKVRGGGIGPGLSAKFAALYSRTSALPRIKYAHLRAYVQQCKQQHQKSDSSLQSSSMISVLDANQTEEAMMNYVLRETACHLKSVIATWAKEAMASPTFQKRQQEKIAALAAEEKDEKKKDKDDDDADDYETDDDEDRRPIGDAGHKVNHDLTVVVTGGDSDIILDLLNPTPDDNDGDDDDGAAAAEVRPVLHPDTVLPEMPCKVKFARHKHIIHHAISQVLWMHHLRHKNVPKQDINDMLVGQRVIQELKRKRMMRGTVLACRQPETKDDDHETHQEDMYQIVYDDGNRAEMNGEELYDALLLYNKEGENNNIASGEKAQDVLDDNLEEMRDAKRKAAKEACKALEQCVPALVARMAKLEAERMAPPAAEANGNGKRVNADDGDQASDSTKKVRSSLGQQAPPVLPPTKASLAERPDSYVGQRVAKFFDDDCFFGEIVHFDEEPKLWRVLYDDGDEEDFEADEMIHHFELYEINKAGDAR